MLEALRNIDWEYVEPTDGKLDLGRARRSLGPASTWTYLINDDPFREQLVAQLTGPGNSTVAIGAAIVALPYLLLWLIAHRISRRRRQS